MIAKKRQRIERVETAAIQVARDAIAEGQPAAVVAEIAAQDPAARLAFGLELLRAAIELLRAEGVRYVSFDAASNRSSVSASLNESALVDRHHATLAALPNQTLPLFDAHAPKNKEQGDTMWRSARLGVDGLDIQLSGPHTTRCARKQDGLQCRGENGHDGGHDFGDRP